MTNSKRKVGRPRATASDDSGPVKEQILAAARQLFRDQGYSATSTRQIAEAAGLRQPSLFHYFPNKAAIIRTIVEHATAPELAFIERDAAANYPPAVALYRYVRFVHYNLTANPNVIGTPLMFPELTEVELGDFREAYRKIYDTMQRLIAEGVANGEFIKLDVATATRQLFALVESSMVHSREAPAAAEAGAELAALLALRALLNDADELPRTIEAAGPFHYPSPDL